MRAKSPVLPIVAALGIVLLAGCTAPTTAGDALAVEQNKAQVRRWLEEGDNKGNFAIADEVFAPDVVMYHPTSPEPIRGIEPIKQGAAGLHKSFPGYVGTVDDVVGERDKVTVRWTIKGVHKGEFMGIPPTNKPFTLTGITIYRFAGGKIVEAWYAADMMGFFQQLGAMPPSPPPR